MEPITIDLNDLTEEYLEFSLLNRAYGCMYSSPCIIGTLIPENLRTRLDNCSDNTTIRNLIRLGYIKLPEDQIDDAIKLQGYYDTNNDSGLEELVAKYTKRED